MAICDETKPYIFISYSHRDTDRVMNIINRLKSEGYNVWFDGGIDPGTEWDENIARHVQECAYFIAFVSQGYINSKNCKDELNYSRDLDKEQLLVYLEDVELPGGMAMRMNRIQAIWWNKYDKNNIDDAYEKLFSSYGIEKTKISEAGSNTNNDGGEVKSIYAPSSAAIAASAPKSTSKIDKKILIGAGAAAAVVIVLLIVLLGGSKKNDASKVAGAEDTSSQTVEEAQDTANDTEAIEDTEVAEEADANEEAEAKAEDADASANADKAQGLMDLAETAMNSQDYTTAYNNYTEAAALGNAYAETKIGLMYEQGNGMTKDLDKAYEHYMKAYEGEDDEAACRIGFLYSYNYPEEKRDYDKAYEYFNKALEINSDHYSANCGLGMMHRDGFCGVLDNGEPDYETSRKYFEKSWANGEGAPYSAYAIGDMYENGKLGEPDYAKAHEYYLASYEKGYSWDYAAGSVARSELLMNKNEATTDEIVAWNEEADKLLKEGKYQDAYDIFLKSAGAGSPLAFSQLGLCYGRDKWFGTQDYNMSLAWFKLGEDVSAFSCYQAGQIYEVQKKDIENAKKYYQKCVDLGDTETGMGQAALDALK